MRLPLPVLLMAVVALTGCAAFPGDSAISPTSTATTSHVNKHGAPLVTQAELDITPFVPDPCRLLSPAQLAQLGVTVIGRPGEGRLGKFCRWIGTDTPARSDFSLNINTQLGGLDRLYGRKREFPLWQPLEVAGYPAVIADDADKELGQCRINLAVSNTVLVAAGLQLRSGVGMPADFTNPCPRVVALLDQVLVTVKSSR
ncbi:MULTISPECIES: DUF3558 domain-containing protein [unclassified Crossiella]|uniref:DUF3558 domain-containing protein n=1 Tax=unclassified Crossiella TaxID=2620835 RepID=UPI001FFED30C|nr:MULTISPECIES: DUF3558 domain-containing protein [unclassified Crossiella]MCK2245243.1 DUF3558 domain-containing protein [Crossiella sp. S99.2]MCK2258896.1 DUF3558 domain-containing protein [Crossiella sp. S99.1]